MRGIMLGLALLAFPSVASAQGPQCAPYPMFVDGLTGGKYAEEPVGRGLSGSVMVEVWANGKTGTWTIIIVRPDGIACGVSSGEAWETAAPKPKGTKS